MMPRFGDTLMISRRTILAGGALAGLGAAGAVVWSDGAMGSIAAYNAEMQRMRRDVAATPDAEEFVRYATLAANGHNAQPWTFGIAEDRISILPDFRRRTPVVDPDDHHLFVSLGCAAENLALTAAARGKAAEVNYSEQDGGAIDVRLTPARPVQGELFDAIPRRQCTRSTYSGATVPPDDLNRLLSTARDSAATVVPILERRLIEKVLELLVAANRKQVADPAFVRELQGWIRFNPAAALAKGDGLFSAASGNPSVPSALGGMIFPLVFNVEAETRKLVDQVRSSAGLAVFFAGREDPNGWIGVGRLYQRFALQATALGIRNAMLNQPVELPEFRRDLAQLAGRPGDRPDLLVRFGYAAALPMSPRRKPADLVAARPAAHDRQRIG